MGMLFRKHLVMFGPREVLLTSDEPVVRQFLNGRRLGPIGMSEEKDESTVAEEQAMVDAGHHDGGVEEIEGVPLQIMATPGMPERQAVGRRQARVREMMHTLPPAAQEPIRDDLEGTTSTPRTRFPTIPRPHGTARPTRTTQRRRPSSHSARGMRVTERSLHVDDDESPPRIHTARGSVTQHPRAIDVEAEFDQFVAELIPMAARDGNGRKRSAGQRRTPGPPPSISAETIFAHA